MLRIFPVLLLNCVCIFAAPKNIVLFVTDDQSPDMSCYGNEALKTPNMDALAADGTLFRYAFCTTASCSASRSVILTGLHNHANGHYGHQHSYHKFNSYSNIVSLPAYLAAAGYRTARCGKYHVAPEEVYQFDQYIPGNSRSPKVMADNCKSFIAEDSKKPFSYTFVLPTLTVAVVLRRNSLTHLIALEILDPARAFRVSQRKFTTLHRSECPGFCQILPPAAQKLPNIINLYPALIKV